MSLKQNAIVARVFDPAQMVRTADAIAVAVAVSLPWSTSATAILLAIWLIAVLPTLSVDMVRREMMTAAGGLPVAIWLVALLGMLWSPSPWIERLDGLSGFHKLLLVPVLLAHFRRSERAHQLLIGFIASCTVLMIVSWIQIFMPTIRLPNKRYPGIPVKDYISQAAMFGGCIMFLCYRSAQSWVEKNYRMFAASTGLASAFLANLVLLAPSRTAFVVLPLLFAVFAFVRREQWRGVVATLLVFVVVGGAIWPNSQMRKRVESLSQEISQYRDAAADQRTIERTSGAERIEFWRKSIDFVIESPLIGHGTGSTLELFRRSAVGQTGVAAVESANPHNQVLAVAVQIGMIGGGLLIAMWIAHLLLFTGPGFGAWVGLMVVSQNVVSSLFNSHILDFGHGWAYVIGVGVAGGAMLGQQSAARLRTQPQPA